MHASGRATPKGVELIVGNIRPNLGRGMFFAILGIIDIRPILGRGLKKFIDSTNIGPILGRGFPVEISFMFLFTLTNPGSPKGFRFGQQNLFIPKG